MKQLIVIFASLLLSIGLLAQQEVKFSAIIGGDTMSLYQTMDIRFQIEGANSSKPKLPEFRGFEVISSQQSSQFQFVNGKMSRQATYTYTLRAIKEGTMIIEPAKIKTEDGQLLKTERLRVEVLKDGNIKPPPPAAKKYDPFFNPEPPSKKKKKKKRTTITI